MNKYQHLFSPIKIGTVEVPNRIALLPMGVFSSRMMNNDGSNAIRLGTSTVPILIGENKC